MTCGLYEENLEFDKRPTLFFKTTAIDHLAIPPHRKLAGIRTSRSCPAPNLPPVSPMCNRQRVRGSQTIAASLPHEELVEHKEVDSSTVKHAHGISRVADNRLVKAVERRVEDERQSHGSTERLEKESESGRASSADSLHPNGGVR